MSFVEASIFGAPAASSAQIVASTAKTKPPRAAARSQRGSSIQVFRVATSLPFGRRVVVPSAGYRKSGEGCVTRYYACPWRGCLRHAHSQRSKRGGEEHRAIGSQDEDRRRHRQAGGPPP